MAVLCWIVVYAEVASTATEQLAVDGSSIKTNGSGSSSGNQAGRPLTQLPKNFDPAAREQQLYQW